MGGVNHESVDNGSITRRFRNAGGDNTVNVVRRDAIF